MNFHSLSKRTNTCCAICESSNRASICSACINLRLNKCRNNVKSLKAQRDALYEKLSDALVKKGKADEQENWLLLRKEKIAKMREKLQLSQIQVSQGKDKIEKRSCDIKVKSELLDKAWGLLETKRVEELEKNYPNLISAQSLGHRNGFEQNVPSSTASFLAESSEPGKIEPAIEEWISVDPSQIEGVEHWRRGPWLRVYRKITSSRK